MSANNIFNAAVAIAREVVDERSEGARLRSILIGQGSERIKLARDYKDLHEREREWHDRAASEFVAPYLQRIAELEAHIAECEDRFRLQDTGISHLENNIRKAWDERNAANARIAKLEAENKSLRDTCTCRARERSATIAALEDAFRNGQSTELLSQVKS